MNTIKPADALGELRGRSITYLVANKLVPRGFSEGYIVRAETPGGLEIEYGHQFTTMSGRVDGAGGIEHVVHFEYGSDGSTYVQAFEGDGIEGYHEVEHARTQRVAEGLLQLLEMREEGS